MKKTLFVSFSFLVSVLFFGVSNALAATATDPGLGTAGNFVILSNAGITDSSASAVITGNIGAYPIGGASIGVTCAELVAGGKLYDRDAAYTGAGGGSTTCRITDDTLLNVAAHTATGDMFTAYTAAAAEASGTDTFLNVGTGTLGTPGTSDHFVPGVYTWDTAVTIPNDIYLDGSSTDVWVFQISGTLDISSGKKIHLTGGALAKNVFWQVTDATTLGTDSTFEGNILGATGITITTGATLHGRALAGTSVALQAGSIVTVPPALSSTKGITAFSFTEGTGVITGTDIAVTVPYGTNVTALVPTFTITGASVSPLGGVAQNFTSPVTYTVTADDATTKNYTVTVNNIVIAAANRLVALQNANGSWDWDVTDQTGPTATTYYSLTGVTAQGLLDAYALSGNTAYLDAAKLAGDFMVATAISPTQSQNAYNIVFLQDLATASGNTAYLTKANAILTSVFTGDNKWAHVNGNNCSEETGCTPAQLVAAYANYRSSNRGMVPWDIAPFVVAEVNAGNTSLAQAIEAAMIADTANYNNSATNYEIGLTGKVIAAEAVNDPNLSSYVTELVSSQHDDGSFGLAEDGQVQVTSYALMALRAIGDSHATAAASYLNSTSTFGYSGIYGWKDTSGPEFAEGDSEAIHALTTSTPILGCMDSTATNYNSAATSQTGVTCTYPAPAPAPVSPAAAASGFFTMGPNGNLLLLPAIPHLTTPVATPAQGQVLGASAFQFTNYLVVGSRGDDVTELQNRLTSEGVYSGPITGYYGPLTKQGVINFQKKYGISQVGVVGPQTRSKLNSILISTIPGCSGDNLFSITTGQSCLVQPSSIPGCFAGNNFSITTGQSCFK